MSHLKNCGRSNESKEAFGKYSCRLHLFTTLQLFATNQILIVLWLYSLRQRLVSWFAVRCHNSNYKTFDKLRWNRNKLNWSTRASIKAKKKKKYHLIRCEAIINSIENKHTIVTMNEQENRWTELAQKEFIAVKSFSKPNLCLFKIMRNNVIYSSYSQRNEVYTSTIIFDWSACYLLLPHSNLILLLIFYAKGLVLGWILKLTQIQSDVF